MRSLPSQQQAHSEAHASCEQPAQPQPRSHTLTLTHSLTLAFPFIQGAPGHCRSQHWPPGRVCRKPPIPFPRFLPSPIAVTFAEPAAGLLSTVTRIQPRGGEFCCSLVAP